VIPEGGTGAKENSNGFFKAIVFLFPKSLQKQAFDTFWK